jgi:DNA-binding response OmpR family regulator
MPKALVCQVDPIISIRLKEEMKQHGWSVDACDGLLEMLRMVESREYDFIILSLSLRNSEIHTRLGAIKALNKNPKILLNLSVSEDVMPSSLIFEYPVIKGELTTQKVLHAAENVS